VTVTWNTPQDSSVEILSYKLYKSTGTDSYKEIFNGSSNHLEAKNLTPGVQYSFRVTAVNSAGEGIPSDSVFVTTDKGKEFVYRSDFDTNGVICWLGTELGTKSFENPSLSGKVKVARSSDGSGQAKDAINREPATYTSTNYGSGQWYSFNISPHSLIPTHYTLRHDASDGGFIRNWVFQGSNDNVNWITISTHVNDTSITSPKSSATWKIEPAATQTFTQFRIFQMGKNSTGFTSLILAGFEIYGIISP